MNHDIMTYAEWCVWMTPEIEWAGRLWHNYGMILDRGLYVEDWITAERVWITQGDDDVSLRIPVDIRYIPIANRNYSDVMWPEYVAIGAESWTLPTLEQMGWVNPPAPLA